MSCIKLCRNKPVKKFHEYYENFQLGLLFKVALTRINVNKACMLMKNFLQKFPSNFSEGSRKP